MWCAIRRWCCPISAPRRCDAAGRKSRRVLRRRPGAGLVSLEIGEGAIVAIVGANGAGKTTLIRALAGMQPPAGGRVVFRGEDISRMAQPSCLQSRTGAGGRRPAGVPDDVGRGKSRYRSHAAAGEGDARAQPRPRAGDVSGARGARRAGGRHVVRRRTADARHRALPDGGAASDHVRRALARACAPISCAACSTPFATSMPRA